MDASRVGIRESSKCFRRQTGICKNTPKGERYVAQHLIKAPKKPENPFEKSFSVGDRVASRFRKTMIWFFLARRAFSRARSAGSSPSNNNAALRFKNLRRGVVGPNDGRLWRSGDNASPCPSPRNMFPFSGRRILGQTQEERKTNPLAASTRDRQAPSRPFPSLPTITSKKWCS